MVEASLSEMGPASVLVHVLVQAAPILEITPVMATHLAAILTRSLFQRMLAMLVGSELVKLQRGRRWKRARVLVSLLARDCRAVL